MKRGDVILVRLVGADAARIAVDMVEITIAFYLSSQFRYAFSFGPTDERGCVRVSYDDVESQRLESLQAQPWDYKTTLDECDDRVTVYTRSGEELEKATKVAILFNLGKAPSSVTWWRNANNGRIKCPRVDVNLTRGETVVTLPCVAL